jgi:hypothetical protein
VVPVCVTVNVELAIEIVPVRAAVSVFSSIENPTVPFPEPGLPDLTVIHHAWLVADHWQWAGALTVMLLWTLSLVNVARSGEIETAQAGTPSSVTGIVFPAIVSVPPRAASSEFGATEIWTTPFPVPEAPLEIDIHPRSDVADQVQVLSVVTVIESDPPAAPNDSEVFDTEYVHVGGGDGCVGELLSQAHRGTTERARMNR